MARTESMWETGVGGTYIQTISPSGYDVLINGTSKYLNFNTVVGSTGYGIRDNGGTMQFKNSGGSWTDIGSGAGGGTWGSITGTLSSQTDLQSALDAKVSSVSGTVNRITSTGGATPVIDISASYVGQVSITTLGTVTIGTLSTGAVIGGVTMTLGSDASYDIYYRNSSGVLTRLANGTTGQVLTATTSNAPSWMAASGGSGITIGTTTITSGADTKVLFDNAGVVGEYTITGSGNVAMSASPTFTGTITAAIANFSGAVTITGTGAAAFAVGPNGNTNPVFRVVDSTASQADGISVTGLAAGSGVTLTALSSGSNAPINLVPKGTGAVQITSANPTELIIANTTNSNAVIQFTYNNGTSAGGVGGWTGGGIAFFNTAGSSYNLTSTATTLTVTNATNIGWSAGAASLSQDTSLARGSLAGLVATTSARTSGSQSYLSVITPADTTLTASTEALGIQFGGNSSSATVTRQFATGAITTQREYLFVAPTYGFVGASTIINAGTVVITGAPIQGTNATITNSYALWVQSGGTALGGKIVNYNGVATVAWGVPAINGSGRATGQTVANNSVATYTVGASDGSFLVSVNVNITAGLASSVGATVTYTDETNTVQTLTLPICGLTGTIGTTVSSGPGEGVTVQIRCKASTAITIKSTVAGSPTYNVEGIITQIS